MGKWEASQATSNIVIDRHDAVKQMLQALMAHHTAAADLMAIFQSVCAGLTENMIETLPSNLLQLREMQLHNPASNSPLPLMKMLMEFGNMHKYMYYAGFLTPRYVHKYMYMLAPSLPDMCTSTCICWLPHSQICAQVHVYAGSLTPRYVHKYMYMLAPSLPDMCTSTCICWLPHSQICAQVHVYAGSLTPRYVHKYMYMLAPSLPDMCTSTMYMLAPSLPGFDLPLTGKLHYIMMTDSTLQSDIAYTSDNKQSPLNKATCWINKQLSTWSADND